MTDWHTKMTDEIAFKLGKFDFPRFYGQVLWKVNKEVFKYCYFFEWGMGIGMPAKQLKNGTYGIDWKNIHLHGRLRKEVFESLNHKLNFIRGRLKSYSVSITGTEINVCWANSYDLRDMFCEFLREVLNHKYGVVTNSSKFNIEKTETIGTIPGTPSIKLTADKEVIDFIIKGERFAE